VKSKRSDLVVPALFGLGLGLVVFVLSVIGKNHFGPLDGLCNGSLEIEPHQGTGAIANCTLDTTLYSVSVYAYWAAIVVGVLSAAVFVIGLVVAPEKLATSNPPGATTKVRRPATTRQVAHGRAPLPDIGRQHIRCAVCNALNYANPGDVPCYACGAALSAAMGEGHA
jgi:hypothetical protein